MIYRIIVIKIINAPNHLISGVEVKSIFPFSGKLIGSFNGLISVIMVMAIIMTVNEIAILFRKSIIRFSISRRVQVLSKRENPYCTILRCGS
jgi:hypothetical protein